MAREPEELAERRRVLGAQLTAFRQAVGLTQGQLARVAFCDRSTVAHIEKGRSRGDERFWTVADERCGADGALRAGFHAWVAAKQDHEVRIQEAQLAQARAKAESLRATTAPQLLSDAEVSGMAGEGTADGGDQITEQLVRLLCGLVGPMNRRKLLQLLRWAAATTAVSPMVAGLNIEEQERLARAIVSPSRIDERVIDHIDAMLRHCKRQEDTLGSRAVLPMALGQHDLINDLLSACPSDLRPRLLSVYSDVSSSVGFYFLELNDFDSAWGYYGQARAAAHDAGNTELGIYALCEMSYAASLHGKAHTGIDLAAAAQSLTGRTDDPLLRVAAADKAARAYATDGQYAACMVECERAQDSLSSAGPVSAESPAYWCNEGLLACDRSDYLVRLGKPAKAAATASTALALFDKSFVGSLGYCTLFLGNAHLQSGEIDEAARVLGDAAGLAVQTRSARLVKELRTTRARMQPWQGSQAVSALDGQLVACGFASERAGV
jgi:transcriptional regulator with XRE-family HTH domain